MQVTPIFWLRGASIALLVYVASQTTSVLFSVLLAVVLSFILNPLVEYIALFPTQFKRKTIPRSVAILLAFIVFSLLVAMAVTFILVPFIREFDKFLANLPELIHKLQNIFALIQQQATTIALPASIQLLVEQEISRAASFSLEMTRRIFNFFLGFASKIIELIVVPVLTYYFLKDWRVLKEEFLAFFPSHSQAKAKVIIEETGTVISRYIQGQFLISIIIGCIIFTAMYIMNVDYPLVLGLLAAITETIPIIGPIIGAVPAILLAYTVNPSLAVKVAIVYMVIQQLENHIIVPKIMGHTIQLHPSIVIISFLIGGHLYGIIGMILAVPVAAIFGVFSKHLWYYGKR